MSIEKFTQTCSLLGAILIALAGCSRSNQSADNAPLDVRGEPIAPPPAAKAPASATGAAAVAALPAPVAISNATPAAAAVAAPAGDAPKTGAVQKDGSFTNVTFDKLASYEFVMPDETVTTNGIVSASAAAKAPDPFPATIKALNETRVALKGFMLPLKVESGLVTEMLIMRDQSMCCYGKVPKITEWVSVKMEQKGVKAIIDQPILLFGKLHVGEIRENGYLVGIYRMDGEKMEATE